MELSSVAAAELEELGARSLLPTLHLPASGGLLHLDPACASGEDEWYTLEVSALEVLSPGWSCSCCFSPAQWQRHLPDDWPRLADDLFELSYRLGRHADLLRRAGDPYVPSLVSVLEDLEREDEVEAPMSSPVLEPALGELRSRRRATVSAVRGRLRSQSSRERLFPDLGIVCDSGPLVAVFATASTISHRSDALRNLKALVSVLPSAALKASGELRAVVVLPLTAATHLSFGVKELLPCEGAPTAVLETALKLWDPSPGAGSPRAVWEAALALHALES